MSPLFRYNGKLLVVDGKLATNENCCCKNGICWARSRGVLFPQDLDDLDVDDNSDLSQCKVVVDYFAEDCPTYYPNNAYPYLDPAKIMQFVQAGGLYITNCEWTNCEQSPAPGTCDSDGEGFKQHMAAIGANLSRGIGTISSNPVYNSLGSKLFENCNIQGNATSEIVGGTPLLNALPGDACGDEPGGICCGGSKVGQGAVVAFGDSNVEINNAIRNNILNNPVANLF